MNEKLPVTGQNMKKIALILLFPLCAFAQISKSGTFKLNDYANLTTGVVTNGPVPSDHSRKVYACSTSAVNRDFFINYFDNSTCICACPSGAIGSPRPFYRYKQSFDRLNLFIPLVLSDTVQWARIDTAKKDPYLSECALPYYIDNMSSGKENCYIVTASNNKYTLVTTTQIINTVQCSYIVTPGTIDYWTQSRLEGYNVKWYMNSSGSVDFSWVNHSGVEQPGLTHQTKRTAVTAQSNAYTLLGQKVPVAQLRKNSVRPDGQSLYIVNNQGKIGLIFK
jgi:hypothetical protein